MRAEEEGELRFFLIGGRALEAHGVVRFTKDVDFMVTTEDIPAVFAVRMKGGYRKSDENAIFSRWKHPSMIVDDVDVMYVNALTFGKLMEGAVMHQLGPVKLRVPSVSSLIALNCMPCGVIRHGRTKTEETSPNYCSGTRNCSTSQPWKACLPNTDAANIILASATSCREITCLSRTGSSGNIRVAARARSSFAGGSRCLDRARAGAALSARARQGLPVSLQRAL